MSTPSSTIRPWSGRRIPDRTSKSVVFPAPFGPISPHTSPARIPRSTPVSALTPPNRTLTPLARSTYPPPLMSPSPDRPR